VPLKKLSSDTAEDRRINELLRRLNIGLMYENQARSLRRGLEREIVGCNKVLAVTGTAPDGSPRFMHLGGPYWYSIPVGNDHG